MKNSRKKRRQGINRIGRLAVKAVCEFEISDGAKVTDVSIPSKAQKAGWNNFPGFDIVSVRRRRVPRYIEIKGKSRKGDIRLTANEWRSACDHKKKFWLYVVFALNSKHPFLVLVQNPSKLVPIIKKRRQKMTYVLSEKDIMDRGIRYECHQE
jgi:hypothetical protein